MVLAPLLLTVPFWIAPVAAIAVAALVVTAGAHAAVVNVVSPPLVVPALLAATTRKW